MADSGHFNGTNFQGVDDDATRNTAPLSAALEGKIANNAQWLHENGAGTAVKRFVGGTTGLVNQKSFYPKNTLFGIVHQQPFLVTKGLKIIQLLIQCTVEDHPISFEVGIDWPLTPKFYVEVEPTVGAIQQFVKIDIVLPTPADIERISRITISARSNKEAMPSFPDTDDLLSNEGFGQKFGAAVAMTNISNRVVVLYQQNLFGPIDLNSDERPQLAYADPIYRQPVLTGSTIKASYEYNLLGNFEYFELESSFITIRSISFRQEFV